MKSILKSVEVWYWQDGVRDHLFQKRTLTKYFLIFRGGCREDIDASGEIPLPRG